MPAPTKSASASPTSTPRKPLSAKKLAANRANAARSTGPRTPDGKARSALNAITHGMTAHCSVLPHEDEDELEEMADAFEADLRPRGEVERLLVQRIVNLAWRLRRIARVEQGLWDLDDDDRVRSECVREMFPLPLQLPIPEFPNGRPGHVFLARQFNRRETSPFERLGVYEQRTDRALHAALRQFDQLRKSRAARGEIPGESEQGMDEADVEALNAADAVDEPIPSPRSGSESPPPSRGRSGGRNDRSGVPDRDCEEAPVDPTDPGLRSAALRSEPGLGVRSAATPAPLVEEPVLQNEPTEVLPGHAPDPTPTDAGRPERAAQTG